MKICIKFIIVVCMSITAILYANKANAQEPPYVEPSRAEINMAPGEIRLTKFQAYNAIVEQVLLMNEMDPGVPIEIDNHNSFFNVTIKAVGPPVAIRVLAYVLKVVLRGNPTTGIIIFACEVIINLYLLSFIISTPIQHLPLVALMTERLKLKPKNTASSSLEDELTEIPVNLTIA